MWRFRENVANLLGSIEFLLESKKVLLNWQPESNDLH